MNEINIIEILHPKMDILFVALNPPKISNTNGHYFSRNLSFWNILFDAGLIIQRVKSPITGDDEVFRDNAINYKRAIFGITDLCNNVLETNSSRVTVNADRPNRILNLLNSHNTKVLCLMHKKVSKAFEEVLTLDRKKRYGLIGRIGTVKVFEMPFHNASIPNKHLEYKKLIAHL